jgi:hypothetical protein
MFFAHEFHPELFVTVATLIPVLAVAFVAEKGFGERMVNVCAAKILIVVMGIGESACLVALWGSMRFFLFAWVTIFCSVYTLVAFAAFIWPTSPSKDPQATEEIAEKPANAAT